MVNKKGYLKTLEAFLAIIVTVFFVLFIAPKEDPTARIIQSVDLQDLISQDHNFRYCIIDHNFTCVDSVIRNNIDEGYINYTFNISSDYNQFALIDKENVFRKSYFLSGNSSEYKPVVLRFYYWVE